MSEEVPFRAAIVDIRLPDGDGVELGEDLQKRFSERGFDVVYITGYAQELADSLRELFKAPRMKLLEKPFDTHQLLRLVRESIS